MSFQFRLQRVIDLKTKEKEQAEWNLAQANQEKMIREEAVMRRQSQKDLLHSDLMKATETTVSVAELQHLNSFITYVDSALYNEVQRLSQANEKLEAFRDVLKNKYIEVKSWDKMRAKAFEDYQHVQSRVEQSQMEETALSQYMRAQLSK